MSLTSLRRGLVALAGLTFASFAGQVLAQSTASQLVLEEVVITSKKQKDVGGVIVAETVARARSSVTQEFIATQPAGQTIIQTLNLTPGLNFTNNDPYGSSGGNIRLRGFDGARVSLTFDGIPLNDTGNYSVYTNQQLDPEIIERANVNLGTTDVDAPTASATGGTINYLTRKPSQTPGATVSLAGGSNSYKRVFGMFDSGAVGPWGTTGFFAASYQKYDKFKGPGDLEKKQFNLRLYQTVGDDSFVSFAAHWNVNRNNNIRQLTLSDFNTFGPRYDYEATCNLPSHPGTPGVADNDNAGSSSTPGTPAACTNYYGRQINPSNTGNVRIQSSWKLNDALRLTADPYVQYTLADGGSQTTTLSERDLRVIGASKAIGVDLNGDGDTLDTVRLFAPSITNTYRLGGTTSLIWDINATNRVRAAYTIDFGRHHQTGQYTYLDASGNPLDPFGGRNGPQVLAADGSYLRARDRYSIAELQQVALEYRGQFVDDRLTLTAGLRSPHFRRTLNQYCYSQNSSTNVLCTTQPIVATLANGNVTFAPGATATQYIAPYSAVKKYQDTLPNVGVSWKLDEAASVYLSYAEGLSAPRTDNLYTVSRLADGSIGNPGVQPEKTKTFDLGYRYAAGRLIGSVTAWSTKYDNRIVTSYNPDDGTYEDRNIGAVDQYGLDGQLGYQPIDTVTLYGSASYDHSEVKSNIPQSTTTFLPTAGKTLVETPKWTVGGRVEWKPLAGLRLGAQAKYVGSRFSTDVNDETAPSYTVMDVDAEYGFVAFGKTNFSAQLNVTNLTDKVYFGSISSQNNAITIPNVRPGGAPTYYIGAPRTVQLSLRASF